MRLLLKHKAGSNDGAVQSSHLFFFHDGCLLPSSPFKKKLKMFISSLVQTLASCVVFVFSFFLFFLTLFESISPQGRVRGIRNNHPQSGSSSGTQSAWKHIYRRKNTPKEAFCTSVLKKMIHRCRLVLMSQSFLKRRAQCCARRCSCRCNKMAYCNNHKWRLPDTKTWSG